MKIFFEQEIYSHTLLEEYGLDSYACTDKKGQSKLPYVGYFYSAKIKDCIFILPKVFIKVDDSCKPPKKIAFGKDFKNEKGENLNIYSVIDITSGKNILKHNGMDKMVFELSTWIYRAINKYWTRHPESDIIRRDYNQIVESVNGQRDNTLLDLILSLEKFHKEHTELFTYITIVNSSGHNKIHWSKTISKVLPVVQNDIPYYVDLKNKNKIFNYDEELIVLFYSVLGYLRNEHMSSVRPNANYNLMRPAQIKRMIENGRGTKLLRKIRRKYFKDELVKLWKLLFAFFSKAEEIHSGKCSNEALLASSFDRVFEDMMDVLVSHDFFSDLKKNKDNKRIDHIYKDKSLLGDGDIFYIGDSKYYSEGHEIEDESIYKQFTYAKNIIQHNINLRYKNEEIEGVRYRDDDTDGYNFSPNFFIRGYIDDADLKDGKIGFKEIKLEPHTQEFEKNFHFDDRPFDRDTLLLQSYNINFLYVLASYVNSTHNGQIQEMLHRRFRTDLIHKYNREFDFYKATPSDKKMFIQRHFYDYRGQMYSLNAESIIFAFNSSGDAAEYNKKLNELEAEFKDEATVTKYKLADTINKP